MSIAELDSRILTTAELELESVLRCRQMKRMIVFTSDDDDRY